MMSRQVPAVAYRFGADLQDSRYETLGRIVVGKDADLQIIGTRGRGKVNGLLLGSVRSSCVGNAACSVLVVNADASA